MTVDRALQIAASILIRDDPSLAHEVARQLASNSGGLTKRQADTLGFIRSYHSEHGITPTYSEIRDHLGIASKSGVNRIVVGIEDRGFIRRIPHRARSIALVGVVA